MKAITLILLFTASVLAWSKGGAGTWPVDSFESPFEIRYRDIRNVYDGDTLTLNCPNCKKGKLRIRLMGVDTPEMRAQCDAEKQLAIKARDFLQEKLRKAHKTLVIPNQKRNRDRYGRLLADIEADDQNISHLLIEHQLGRPYQGGRRVSWCD